MMYSRPVRASRLSKSGALFAMVVALSWGRPAVAATLSNGTFTVQTGTYGEISSLRITGDTFPTDYVLNVANARGLANSAEHHWFGELMFKYRLGASGAWSTASTSASDDVRRITSDATSVTVTYESSSRADGIKNFKVAETYALVDDYLSWRIAVTNTSTQPLEIGDFGLPLPWNQYWFAGDEIYETRVQFHSFVGNASSYITATRPSGMGPFVLMTPDASTGAGFEYMDHWRVEEHAGSLWAQDQGNPGWPNGLNVFYLHSNAVKSTGRGYLPNTSLTLAPGAGKTYAFKFFKVTSAQDVKDRLYREGLIDVTALPGMLFPTDMTAAIDLHTSKAISSVTAQYPGETTLTPLGVKGTDHHLYRLKLGHLGPNNIAVGYGNGETTVLQFYAMEPAGAALQRHAAFIVEKTQWTDRSVDQYGIFDDWMMGAKSKRNNFSGGWGWGDDWGWTHGEFLAEKNAQSPVAAEVEALDVYLDAVWNRSIDHNEFIVQDWWCPKGTSAQNTNNCYYDRAFAYPHAFNTYLGMYKIAQMYPSLAKYRLDADAYLMRAFNILNALYSGHGDPGTGYMGEMTIPEIRQALSDAGHSAEASRVDEIITQIYQAFRANKYPYGSEYSFDNTGEEAVYMAARAKGDTGMMKKINDKSRACRGEQPAWYYYANPVTVCGEAWWNFQYSMSLIGYCLDDWLRYHSTQPELDERINYAAKLGNLSAINSGQIDADPANLGAVAWTYQSEKGKTMGCSADCYDSLHNGWRGMSGEADLGLFGAIRVLSADVAVDPVFGLFGYGCDVGEVDGCYTVAPRDGVQKRLNLITEKVYVSLDRDQYTEAVVSSGGDYVGFTLKNQYTTAAHITKVTLSGLKAGTYDMNVGTGSAKSVTISAGKPAVVDLAIGTEPTYEVVVALGGKSCQRAELDAGGGEDVGSSGGVGHADGGGGLDGGAGGGDGDSAANSVSGGCGCRAGTGAERGAGGLIALIASGVGLARRRVRRLNARP
jgi:hypothetical protein